MNYESNMTLAELDLALALANEGRRVLQGGRVEVEVTSAYVINLRLRATGYQRPFYFGNKG